MAVLDHTVVVSIGLDSFRRVLCTLDSVVGQDDTVADSYFSPTFSNRCAARSVWWSNGAI